MQTNPTELLTLSDYISALENLTRLHESMAAENRILKDKNRSLMENVEALKDILTEARQAPSPFKRDIESLVSARYAFRSGNSSDGMYELEKVLSGADSSWRTRVG